MTDPKTKPEWWSLLKQYRPELEDIIKRFSPEYSISFGNAIGRHDSSMLLTIMNDAWWKAPDSPEIHRIPGWSALCSLCSENYLVQPEPV